MTFHQFKAQALLLFSFLLSAMTNAGTPLWSFTPSPLYPTSAVLFPPYESATVQYTVTNNSSSPHSLYMVPIQGITPTVTGCSSSPNCIAGAEFCLPGKNSTCTLTLSIDSSQLLGNVTKGPELCQYGQTKQGPSKQQCYTPANPLNITLASAPTTTLSVSPNTIIPVKGASSSLTVTNTGEATAFAVSAQLSSLTCTTSSQDVIQDSTGCAVIPAGQSCTLNFTSSTPCLAKSIPIVGGNISNNPTAALAFSIQGYLVFALSSDSSTDPQVVDNANLATGEWTTNNTATATTSLTDGYTNTAAVQSNFGVSAYVNLCYNKSSSPANAWYLPAICQMSVVNSGAGCTNSNANTIDNLVQLGFIVFIGNNQLWSSSISGTNRSWVQFWSNTTTAQNSIQWFARDIGRCARSITY